MQFSQFANKKRHGKKISVALVSFLFALTVFLGGFFNPRAQASVVSVTFFKNIVAIFNSEPTAAGGFLMAICEPTRLIYRNIMEDQPQSSILRTHYFLTAAGPLNLIYTNLGTSIDNVIRCIPGIGPMVDGICEAGTLPAWTFDKIPDGDFWDGLRGRVRDPRRCGPLLSLFSDNTAGIPGMYGGSLAGIAQSLHYVNQTRPPPTSLALFWNDAVGDMPVVGKALAADSMTVGLRDPLTRYVLVAWKAFRNLSFGLLAIYMFYVGILIMTRKHVDQRTVVTVQYALPKLVIAVLLIAFSYAIGAVVAQLSWYLAHNAQGIVKGAFTAADPTGTMTGGALDLTFFSVIGIWLLVGLVFTIPTGGISMVIVLAIILLVMIVLYMVLEIKLLIVYLKLVMSIITAPIEILFYSIPGSEKGIGEWFKKLGGYAVGMISIRTVYWVVVYTAGIAMLGMQDTVHNPAAIVDGESLQNFLQAQGGLLIMLFLYPLIMIFGLITAFTIPKKIEALVTGKKSGGKR
jgi:hypothetical protein